MLLSVLRKVKRNEKKRKRKKERKKKKNFESTFCFLGLSLMIMVPWYYCGVTTEVNNQRLAAA